MSRQVRLTLIGIAGLVLLVLPTLIRANLYYRQNIAYVPPPTDDFTTAATPIPTSTSLAQMISTSNVQGDMKPRPVLVDLAHFNRLDRTKFQPLASALAQRGVGMRFWLPVGIDPVEIQSFLDFPDQSDKLSVELENASALVIVSPFFLWTPKEIEQVVQFVADGGLLFLVSDPDNFGDVARDINNVGDPFGIVFADDYLYNTERNDENFTYTFQGQFLDQAADLADKEIVFYGARSINGSVTPQIISGETTLSSAQSGVTGFTTVAVAGLPTNETEGRVLAMSDFDVLSEPFVTRFQNRAMVDFVADFLAGGKRLNTLTDFPGSLGKEVALVYGSENTVDAELLGLSAQLQRQLVRSGRELLLVQSAPLLDGQIISTTRSLTGPIASRILADFSNGRSNTISITNSTRISTTVETSEQGNSVPMSAGSDAQESVTASETLTNTTSEDNVGNNGRNGNEGEQEAPQGDTTQSTTIPQTSTPTPTGAPSTSPASQLEKMAEPLPTGDLIYLADFETAGKETTLLADAGFTLIHVARTPTPTPTPTFTPTSIPTSTPTVTPTASPTPISTATVAVTIAATSTVIVPSPTVSLDATAVMTSSVPISGTEGITLSVPITSSVSITEGESITATELLTTAELFQEGDKLAQQSREQSIQFGSNRRFQRLTQSVLGLVLGREISPIASTDHLTDTGTLTDSSTLTDTEDLTSGTSITETGLLTTATPVTQSIDISQTATPVPTPKPLITAYLLSDSGLQLSAAETVVLLQVARDEQGHLVAVLGPNDDAIEAGLKRLLEGDYGDCVLEENKAVCPYAQGSMSPGPSPTASGSNGDNGSTATATPAVLATSTGETATPATTSTAASTPTVVATRQPVAPGAAQILVIDDNDVIADGEVSEADFYISTLVTLGTAPFLWSIADSGVPTGDDLKGYDWIIWSSAGYSEGGPTVADLDPIFEYLNEGGRITISSRNTFFGQTQDPPSSLGDVQKTADIPALVEGFPAEPIRLTEGIPNVAPIQANTEENPSLTIVLRRGPESDDAAEPLMFVLVDEEPESTGARLLVLGMSVQWLPDNYSEQLINNMMTWVLE
ncbi:MAG: hypothetical protein AAF702_43755 [Chloroflexota bacterium]